MTAPDLPPVAGRPPLPVDDAAWWHGAVGYQIYPRSFADSDGSGVGDLWGVLEHVDHVADLGVDFVWFNPVYPSPGFDHGYDVADYTDIDAAMGGMDAFEAIRDALHDRGIRLLMDIVPGHTSHLHPWFVAARADVDAPERDLYVWRDPAPDGGPPNNWVSVFGGSAWELDEASGQYWMHRFLPEQPDLNWFNPAVADRMEQVLRFWFERGIDGFRVDVAQGSLFDDTFSDRPAPPAEIVDDADAVRNWMMEAYFGHPDAPRVWERWRRVADEYDALLLGEVYLEDPYRVANFATDERLHRAFYLPLQHIGWDRDTLAEALQVAVDAGRGRFSWPQSSHDDPRAAERFGGGDQGRRRALAFFHLIACLPGNPVMLAGDELGLDNGEVDQGHAEDPITVRNSDRSDGRDGSRTPMTWDHDQPNFGFTTGDPWLPIGANRTAADSVATQTATEGSTLQRMRRLLTVRHGLTTMLATNDLTWLDLDADVIALRRGDVTVVCNFGAAREVTVPDVGNLVLSSSDEATLSDDVLSLGHDECALLQA